LTGAAARASGQAPVRAIGTESDIRLEAPEIGGSGPDVDMRAGGNIVLTGRVTARDVALEAGGLIQTQAIRANDDIAIRAVGTVSTGALTSGFATAVETDATGSADDLLADRGETVTLTGNDIDVRGSAVTVPAATAGADENSAVRVQSDLRLRSDAGRLELGTGAAAGRALLDKRGTTDELQVTSLSTGLAPGADGDAIIVSATNVRAGSVTALGGTIDIRAGDDVNSVTFNNTDGAVTVASTRVRTGDVTGLPVSEDSRGLRPNQGRAVLTARADGRRATSRSTSPRAAWCSLGRSSRTTTSECWPATCNRPRWGRSQTGMARSTSRARPPHSARLSCARSTTIRPSPPVSGSAHGRTAPVSKPTPAAGESRIGTSVTLVTTSDGDAANRSRGDIIVAQTLTAGTNGAGPEGTVTIDAVGDAHLASGTFFIESLTGNIAVTSRSGDVTGITPVTAEQRAGSASGRYGSIRSGGTTDIDAVGDIRIGQVTSTGGDILIDSANGSVTGLR
jgi:hypothetical protein